MDGASGAAAPDPGQAHDEDELLDRVRAGDAAAFERLYAAHAESARRLATILAGPDVGEELVSESFARILDQLRLGAGPRTHFRAYLHTTIRNRHRDLYRRARETPASDQPWLLDGAEPSAEEQVSGIDANGAMAALGSLPGAWQKVLWHLEVEGRKPAEVADLLTMTPAAVSSLAYRAREGLRRAYLDQHVTPVSAAADCDWTRSRMSKYVRGETSRRASAKIADHIAGCLECAGVYDEIDTLNKKLAAYLFPVVLIGGMQAIDNGAGPLAAAVLVPPDGSAAGSAAGSSTTSGSGGIGGLSTQTVALAAAGVVAAAVVLAVFALLGNDEPRVEDAPEQVISDAATPKQRDQRPTRPADPSTPQPERRPKPSPTPTPTSPVATPVPESEPGPAEVRPAAPAAVPITRCETYGSLRLPTTKGVRYARTVGDGREGRWEVRATIVDGYVLAEGGQTRFSGNLGTYFACPSIAGVTKTPTGDPASRPWNVVVTPLVAGSAAQTIDVTYMFDTRVIIASRSGSGWNCRGPRRVDRPLTPVTCSFDYSGRRPGKVTLAVHGLDGDNGYVEPSGFVSLSSNGAAHDLRPIP